MTCRHGTYGKMCGDTSIYSEDEKERVQDGGRGQFSSLTLKA